MAVLLVAIAVMLTLMSVAMPVWRQQARREREEELLFRLKQYAHALSLYQRRVPGGSPGTVDELVKQRYLRRKYLDPMTGKDFAVLRVGQVSPGMSMQVPGVSPGPDGRTPTTGPGRGSGGIGTSPGTRPSGPASPGGMQPGVMGGAAGGAVGGIRGVVSTSKDSSLRIWKGRTQYDQWEVAIEDVTPRFLGQQQQPGQGNRPGGSRGPGQNQPGQNRPGQTSPSGAGPSRSINPYGPPPNRQ
jgi:type II secretory pathway pseudopilin PulG